MKTYRATKRKINKIEFTQQEIDNILFQRNNKTLKQKASLSVNNKIFKLIETEYFAFESFRLFGSLVAQPIIMNITSDIFFSGNISIPDEFIPYIKGTIIVKKPETGNLVGVSVKDVYLYNNNALTVQLEPNKQIFEEVEGGGLILVGNTGSTGIVNAGTSALFIELSQRNVDNTNMNFPITWEKLGVNEWSYDIGATVMAEVPSEENVGTVNFEGNIDYEAQLFPPGHPNEGEVESYIREDNRVNVHYDAYRPFTYDFEAKLLLYIDTKNLENKKVNYTL